MLKYREMMHFLQFISQQNNVVEQNPKLLNIISRSGIIYFADLLSANLHVYLYCYYCIPLYFLHHVGLLHTLLHLLHLFVKQFVCIS